MLGVAAPATTLSVFPEALAAVTTGTSSSPSVGEVLVHLLVDLVAVGLLVGVAYRHRRADQGMAFALVVLNVGLFATLVAITGEAFSTSAGFGLFGMLSLIRLRSASFTTPDMAYTFLALVLGLVTGLVGLPLWLTLGACALLVGLAVVGDRPARTAAPAGSLDVAPGPPAAAPVAPAVRTRKVDVVLDGAFGTVAAARAEVEARLDVDALDVVLDEVDYVREVTRVRVIVAVPAGDPAPAPDVQPSAAAPGFAAYEHHEEYAQYAAYGVPADVDPTVVAARLPLQLPPPQDLPSAPWGRPRTRQPEPGRRARRLGATGEIDVRGGYAEAPGLSRLLGPVDPR
ncbi:DUF4956 domain-containing protein [Kineosporia sp. A_224]|uniref:DUF4956 domain-containing protein n=1 Tax=Kineosporia sp. A_224 TaxID=1962180 RepID=UPI000B4AF2AF|nr:DUF4956 domain-containing protein [Kineosporia sp. A_224]